MDPREIARERVRRALAGEAQSPRGDERSREAAAPGALARSSSGVRGALAAESGERGAGAEAPVPEEKNSTSEKAASKGPSLDASLGRARGAVFQGPRGPTSSPAVGAGGAEARRPIPARGASILSAGEASTPGGEPSRRVSFAPVVSSEDDEVIDSGSMAPQATVRTSMASEAELAEIEAYRSEAVAKKSFSGFGAVANSEAAARLKAAVLLLDTLGQEASAIERKEKTRVERTRVEQYKWRVGILASAGGKNGDKLDKCRLFIENWRTWLETESRVADATSIFPMYAADIRAFKEAGDTQARRAEPSAIFLEEMVGDELVQRDGAALTQNVTRRKVVSDGRVAHGPKFVIDAEAMACREPEDVPGGFVVHHYVCNQVVMNVTSARHASIYNSVVVAATGKAHASVLHLKTVEGSSDKVGRAGVDIYASTEGMTRKELPFLEVWKQNSIATGFSCPDWIDGEGPSSIVKDLPILRNQGIKFEEGEDPRMPELASKARAASAMSQVASIVSGVPFTQLQEEHKSGTHAARKIGGAVTFLLGWPKEEADVVGDWSSAMGDTSAFPKLKSAKKKGSGSREKHYLPNSGMSEQVAIRRRYVRAVRTAIEAATSRGMVIDWDTTWEHIIPSWTEGLKDADLAEFYGPLMKKSYEEWRVEVPDESPAAGSKRSRGGK